MLCHGGAGAGSLPCGSRFPDAPRPATQPDDEAPPPHDGASAAVGSAAEPAARASTYGGMSKLRYRRVERVTGRQRDTVKKTRERRKKGEDWIRKSINSWEVEVHQVLHFLL